MADLLGGAVGGTAGDLLQRIEISNTYDVYLDKCARLICFRIRRRRVATATKKPNRFLKLAQQVTASVCSFRRFEEGSAVFSRSYPAWAEQRARGPDPRRRAI